jgi:hypothetical protein
MTKITKYKTIVEALANWNSLDKRNVTGTITTETGADGTTYFVLIIE